MNSLYVLYDPDCEFCRRCQAWLAAQPVFIELRFLPQNSAAVVARFPGIEPFLAAGELTVVSDEGAVYQGASAFLMCLHALQEYRALAARLAHPTLAPFASKALELLTQHRHVFSRWIASATDAELVSTLRLHSPACGGAAACSPSPRGQAIPPLLPPTPSTQ